MAQHDYNIANQTGAAFRADLNNALSAIKSLNSGVSQPSSTTAYMLWADETNSLLKMRNASNNGWISIGDLSGNVLVLDSNKNVGLGTSSPSSYNSNYDNFVIRQSSGNGGMTIATGSSAIGGIAFAESTSGTSAYKGYITYNHSDNEMNFGTEGVERMVLGGGGRLAAQSVQISSDPHNFATTQGASSAYQLFKCAYNATTGVPGTGTDCFIIYRNGDVKNATAVYGSISDIKLKENIVDANSQWDDIKAIRVRNYNLKEGQTHTQIGVIAQEIELVSPGLVQEAPDFDHEGNDLGTTTKSVSYSVLYMKAVKALQEAMERIETLEAKVAALENA